MFFRAFVNLPPTDSKITAAGTVSNTAKNTNKFIASCKSMKDGDKFKELTENMKLPEGGRLHHSDIKVLVENAVKMMKTMPSVETSAANHSALKSEMNSAVKECVGEIMRAHLEPLFTWIRSSWTKFASDLTTVLCDETKSRKTLGTLTTVLADRVLQFWNIFEPASMSVLTITDALMLVSKNVCSATTFVLAAQADVTRHAVEVSKLMNSVFELEKHIDSDGKMPEEADPRTPKAMRALAQNCKSMTHLKVLSDKVENSGNSLHVLWKAFEVSLNKWLLLVVLQSTERLTAKFYSGIFCHKHLKDSREVLEVLVQHLKDFACSTISPLAPLEC